jgi:hypothetical protein
LKDVGALLGCTWTEPAASGLQSLVWRARWEATREEHWKKTLLDYNQEDCTALRKITDFIAEAVARADPLTANALPAGGPPVVRVRDLTIFPPERSWRDVQFADDNFAHVNLCAYFDYQRERVYIRSSEAIRRSQRRGSKSRNRKLRCNKRFTLTSPTCPCCQGTSVVNGIPKEEAIWPVPRLKRAFDLVLTSTGIRRSVVHCRSSVHKCLSCHSMFVPDQHERLDKHFHGLKAWAMYQHVAHRLDLEAIVTMIEEFFGVRVHSPEMLRIKSLMGRYYAPTLQQLLQAILSGNLLHVDETEVNMQDGKAYVWVLTNLEEVVYLYRPNREGDFLKELLKDYRGVLVSDFYAAYDGLECPQQKCLIHLIRDMNQGLLANPFDEELRSVTRPFGALLRAVVTTVDEHGLRWRHLQKHSREVAGYFDHLSGQAFRSEAALALQTRLLKYRGRLFTFLEHDGIPWNNNNAENAIKRFAYYREAAPTQLQPESLGHYLVLLSLFQTCRCKGVNFLRFLMSGERDLDFFCQRRRPRERLPELQLYPEGFTPPHLASRTRKRASRVAAIVAGSGPDVGAATADLV